MINKKVFQKIKFNNFFNIIGDFDFFIKASLKNKFAYLNEPLAIYRIHDNNYSAKNLNQLIFELQSWLKKNKKRIYDKKISLYYQYEYLIKLKIRFFIKKYLGV